MFTGHCTCPVVFLVENSVNSDMQPLGKTNLEWKLEWSLNPSSCPWSLGKLLNSTPPPASIYSGA